jgi:hypothetical protein
MKNKKHLLESIQHFIVGFYLTFEGYDQISCHPIIGGLILFFGLILLIYFFYEIPKKRQDIAFKLFVHLFEGFALLFTAYIFFRENKIYLPYVTLAASVGSFVSVIVLFIKTRKA